MFIREGAFNRTFTVFVVFIESKMTPINPVRNVVSVWMQYFIFPWKAVALTYHHTCVCVCLWCMAMWVFGIDLWYLMFIQYR